MSLLIVLYTVIITSVDPVHI